MFRWLRGIGSTVLLTGLVSTGLAVSIAPASYARSAPGPHSADTDWNDGARGGHGFGRIGPRAARTTTVNPASGPDFELPFGCGQTWTGSSRSGHSPSYYSLDWNTPDDLGKPVLASAPGVVATARSVTGSYGRYVVIDHGRGYSTLYGHLNAIIGVVGQYVDQGDVIGYLGSSGNSTGPHLHFEERLDGAYYRPYFHRATFGINSTVRSLNCNDRPVVGDWDGNGTDDLGVYRSTSTSGIFLQRGAGGTTTSLPFGYTNNLPVAADFDGDRRAQVGVRRPTSGSWFLRSASGATAGVLGVGTASDIPLSGDWDGNGRDGLGFYRATTHTFWLRADDGSYSTIVMGAAGDRPVVGDWNGDHRADVGVFNASNGWWYLKVPSGSSSTTMKVQFGIAGDVPVTGDWDGNGRDEIGIWRPALAQWILRSNIATTHTSSAVSYGYRR